MNIDMIHVLDRIVNVLQAHISGESTATTPPAIKLTSEHFLLVNPMASIPALLEIDTFNRGVYDEVERTFGDRDYVWKYSILIQKMDIYADGNNNTFVVMSLQTNRGEGSKELFLHFTCSNMSKTHGWYTSPQEVALVDMNKTIRDLHNAAKYIVKVRSVEFNRMGCLAKIVIGYDDRKRNMNESGTVEMKLSLVKPNL